MSCIPRLSHVFTCIRQKIKLSLSHALLYSIICFYVCDFNPTERKLHFRENWLIILGILGWLTIFRDLGSQGKNTFREQGKLFSGILEDQCIIFRDQGSTDPLGASAL